MKIPKPDIDFNKLINDLRNMAFSDKKFENIAEEAKKLINDIREITPKMIELYDKAQKKKYERLEKQTPKEMKKRYKKDLKEIEVEFKILYMEFSYKEKYLKKGYNISII